MEIFRTGRKESDKRKEQAMEQKPYYEQVDIQNTMKLRELIASLPPFCGTFFRGIEPTTSSRTRIAYAYDLRVFFEFLIKNNPAPVSYTHLDTRFFGLFWLLWRPVRSEI